MSYSDSIIEKIRLGNRISGYDPGGDIMKMIMFNTKKYDVDTFDKALKGTTHEVKYIEAKLNSQTVQLARGYECACIFVNDIADAEVIQQLAAGGTHFIALRCAGFNNVDLHAARKYGVCVARVPEYSPFGVAEHAVALMLSLNRKIHRAHNRVREGNFALSGLLGFDMKGKTAGVIGTGKIGGLAAKILGQGFGCKILAYDRFPDKELESNGVIYTGMQELLSQSDIVTLHCPLNPETHYIINEEAIRDMKHGAMIINTSRGGLIDTVAVIEGLKSGKIGSLGIDVYEEEGDLFFEDLSGDVIQDDVFARLLTLPNVLVTGHQAYFTREALVNIAQVTVQNVTGYEEEHTCVNAVFCDRIRTSASGRILGEQE